MAKRRIDKKKKRFEFKRIVSCNAIAGILIFGSWATQNFLFNRFDAELSRFHLYSIKRDSLLTLSTTWWMKFVDVRKSEDVSNKDKILALMNFITYSHQLIEQDLRSLEQFDERASIEMGFDVHKNQLESELENYFDFSKLFEGAKPGETLSLSPDEANSRLKVNESKDIEPLAKRAEEYMIWSGRAGKPIMATIEAHYERIEKKANFYNGLFLVLYATGALFAGIGFVRMKGKG